MSIEYMKTMKETKAGTYRMRRVRGHIMVSLTPRIGGEGVVGKTYTVARMEKSGFGRGNQWYASNVRWHKFSNEDGAWQREADLQTFHADSTPSALKEFVCLYDEFFIRTLLEYEGEVFNPITQETRIHYGSIGNDEPLQETWIRISDDEDALARIWNDEFKKLAGAVVPVKRWDNHDDHTRRPQNNIWAVIDREHTAPLGMTTGVGLPPRLWEIIDIDMEYTFSDEQMSFLEPEPAVEPEQQAMDSLVAEIAAKREALSSYVLETSKEISSRSEELARLEAQYKKHRHLDKRDRGASE